MVLHSSSLSYSTACYMLVKEIANSSRKGQLLPQWTLVFVFHAIFHSIAAYALRPYFAPKLFFISKFILIVHNLIVFSGYTLLILLYRHSVQTIFNKKIPPTWVDCIPSFCQHITMLKPLEIIFRYLTRHLRMLPDVIVLGEVRCGTTTLCHHLSHLEDVSFQGPFCLWAHPEMDHKESFYFAGHYLGFVTPFDYRMCFPLQLEKWWYNHKHLFIFPFFGRTTTQPNKIKPFLVFDGCAQYLTSPTAPYLIAEAYSNQHDGHTPSPPLLIACIRNPISQAISWWRYENNAMIWGRNMGLKEWNTQIRSQDYPPKTISKSVEFSFSPFVEKNYHDAESLVTYMLRTKRRYIHLPSWAMTWPSGQLGVFGRNSKYRTNIERYERVFGSYFQPTNNRFSSSCSLSNNFRFTYIIPTESLSGNLINYLSDILVNVSHNKCDEERNLLLNISKDLKVLNPDVRRNATTLSMTSSTHDFWDADEDERKKLHHLLYDDIMDFKVLIK